MQQKQFETAMQDVAKAYGSPADLIADDELTRPQKLKLLQQWDYDLGLLLVAAEENMTGPGSSVTAERMRTVRDAIKLLGVEVDPDDPHAVAASGKVAGVAIPPEETAEPKTKTTH
ncbi:MAG: hypothetical protein HYU58_15945 [Proteobacteria bacterium]|nr:hypothetical protein [Pseudomonadota bacterium]